MKPINIVIIPEWGNMDVKERVKNDAFYDALYLELTAVKINVGSAPSRGVFLRLLDHIAQQDRRYLFLTGEKVKGEDRVFVEERLADLGYDSRWIRGVNELEGSGDEKRERLEGWLKEIRGSLSKER